MKTTSETIEGLDASGNNSSTADSSGNILNLNDMFYQIFTNSNVVILLWFLAIYFVLSILVGLTNNTPGRSTSRIYDFIVFSIVLVYLVSSYFLKSEDDKESWVKSSYQSTSNYINDPLSVFSIVLFIIVLYAIVLLLGIPMDSATKPLSVSVIEGGAWFLFAVILIVNFFKYMLNISITDYTDRAFNGIWKNKDASANDISGNTYVAPAPTSNSYSKGPVVSTPVVKEEVFNISNNIFTYDDAQAVCSAFDSRLATYNEVEGAYNDGGEWCSYGWSENQSIYFPTQKNTWDKLQKTKSHKNDCGRPGVNGGYIENPKVRFGVNCFGVKPKASDKDLKFMKSNANAPVPKTAEEVINEIKVKMFKQNSDKLMQVNSFNKQKWSEY